MRFGLPAADLGAPAAFYSFMTASNQTLMALSSSSAPPADAGLIICLLYTSPSPRD